MPVFTAIAAAVSAALGGGIIGAIGGFIVRAVVTLGISRLATKMLAPDNKTPASTDQGIRLQLEPATDNKVPVVYGSAFLGGAITDAYMTNSNKTMWYCVTITEKTGDVYSTGDPSEYTFGDIYWAQNKINFQSDGITVASTTDTTGGVDNNINGLVKIYLYNDGSTNSILPDGYTGTLPGNAWDVWAGGGVWTAQNRMEGTAFALVRVDYNRDKNITGLSNMQFQVQNSLKDPGDVFYDYATNLRYGAGIAEADIDTDSIDALTAYSQESVTYNGTETLPDRYQINGIIRTQENVLSNLERITSACGSWLSYDIGTGLWGVVINKAFAGTVDLNFDDTNVLGQINLAGTALDSLYNSVEIRFPHRDLRDQPDMRVLELADEDRNPNEPDNRLTLQIDLCNEPVQAQILADLELHANRLEKVITFSTDYSKIQTEAGDIIAIYNSTYGWDVDGGYPDGKDFRVLRVVETEDETGALVVQITAKEYDDVYNPGALTRPTVTPDTGIVGDAVFGTPAVPTYIENNNIAKPTITLKGVVPTGDFSPVTFLEFYATSDVITTPDADRKYFLVGASNTVQGSDNGLTVTAIGTPLAQGNTIVLENVTLPAGAYLFKVRCGNMKARGTFSSPTAQLVWTPNPIADTVGGSAGVQTSCGNVVSLGSHVGGLVSGGDIDFGSVNGFGNGTAGGGNTSAATNNLLAAVGNVRISSTGGFASTLYSVDGTYDNANNWIADQSGILGCGFGAAYSNNRFVTSITQFDSTGNAIVGRPATLVVDYTPDLSTQCPHGIQTTLVDDPVSGVAASGNTVVAMSLGYAYTMTNLNLVDLYTQPNWSSSVTNIIGQDVVKASTRWIGVGETGSGNLGVVYSSTGTSWTDASIAVVGRFFSVAKGTISSTEYVVAGGGQYDFSSGNLAYYSTNVGSTWTAMTGLNSDDFITGIAFGNSRFVAVGFSTSTGLGKIWTSTNGTSWSSVTLPSYPVLRAVDYSPNQNKFYAGGNNYSDGGPTMLISNSTGTTWTLDPNDTSRFNIVNIACFR